MSGSERSPHMFSSLVEAGLLEIGDGYRAKNAELGGHGPIFLRAAYLQDAGFIAEMPERFRCAELEKFGGKVAKLGDVVITTKGNSTGRTGVIREAQAGAVYSPHLSYWRSLDANEIDQRFLTFWALSPEFLGQLAGSAYSTDMAPYLSLRDQSRLQISLPSITEQRAIAATLGALDDKIELNRRMNATLEDTARALFRDWFVDFGPTRAKMAGAKPYLAPDLWDLFPDRLDEDGKPEGWEDRSLANFFSIVGGGTPKTANAEYWGGEIPWFSVVDTPPRGSVFSIQTEKTITKEGVENSSARLVPRGTTIISARGTVGNLAIAGKEMAFNQSCYGLKCEPPVGPYTTYLIAMDLVEHLKSMAHGSVFSTITRNTFESISFSQPSESALTAFEHLISPLFDRILANVNESKALTETRDNLLPRLISGDVQAAPLVGAL